MKMEWNEFSETVVLLIDMARLGGCVLWLRHKDFSEPKIVAEIVDKDTDWIIELARDFKFPKLELLIFDSCRSRLAREIKSGRL